MNIATQLTVNWNYRNFLILSKIFLPHLIAVTILVKLSSNRIIPAASLATSVPAIPIAKPTSAFFKAGASLVPSPVTATTLLSYFSPVTKRYLSSGVERANTFRYLAISENLSKSFTCIFPSFPTPSMGINPPTSFLKSLPCITT